MIPRNKFVPAYVKTYEEGRLREKVEEALELLRSCHVCPRDCLAVRGVIVRHLVMPGLLDDTGEIVRWLAEELSPDTYVNVMDQYYPAWKAKAEAKFSDINRGICESESDQALAYARRAGFWRLDRRWRLVRPRFEVVEIPPAV